jgi:hypothetical protein
VFAAELLIVGHRPLGFVVFRGEHGDVGFQGVTLGLQLLVFPSQRSDGFDDFSDFSFKFFGFGHVVIILLDLLFLKLWRRGVMTRKIVLLSEEHPQDCRYWESGTV